MSILYITGDSYHAGERDYMIALASEMDAKAQQKSRIYKIGDSLAVHSSEKRNACILPRRQSDFANVPVLTIDALHNYDDVTDIIGVGHSTLSQTLEVYKFLRTQNVAAKVHYVTFKIDKQDHAALLENNVQIFAPEDTSEMALDVVKLPCVPNSNTPAACAEEWNVFSKATDEGRTVAGWVADNKPFACVIPNAGFSYNGKHIFSKRETLFSQGLALGNAMPQDTNLLVVEGGPRSILDSAHNHHGAIFFAQGYGHAQALKKGRMQTAFSFFQTTSGMDIDAVKAALYISNVPQCKQLILPCEGYGTMEGALLTCTNKTRPIGMFLSGPSIKEKTRMLNVEKYHKLGIDILRFDENSRLITFQSPVSEALDPTSRNAAAMILRALGI